MIINEMTMEEELFSTGFRKRTNYENADVYKIFSILYGLIIFIGGVSFSISHAIVPRAEAEIIKQITEIYFTYLYWVSITWIAFCIIDIIRHRHKLKMPVSTLNRLDSNKTYAASDAEPMEQDRASISSTAQLQSMPKDCTQLVLPSNTENEDAEGIDEPRAETNSNKLADDNDDASSSTDRQSKSGSSDIAVRELSGRKSLTEASRDMFSRRRALDVIEADDLKVYGRHRRDSIVQHVIGYNYDDNSIVGGLYTRVGIGIFCLGTVVHSSLSILSNLENNPCTRWTGVLDDSSRLLFSFLQFFFVFKHSNLIIRAHESLARLAVLHIVVTNLCVWFRMVAIETISQIAEVDGHEMDLIRNNGTTSHLTTDDQDAVNLLHRLLIYQAGCSNLLANELTLNTHIREGYIRMKPLLYPCTIEFSLMCLTLFYLIWENVGKTFKHKISNKESTKNVFMVNCQASVKGLFAGMICFSCTIISILLYAIFRNKIGDTSHSMSLPMISHNHGIHKNAQAISSELLTLPSITPGNEIGHAHGLFVSATQEPKKVVYGIAVLEIVNLCLLTLSLYATIWSLIKLRKLDYRRTTTRFDDVLIIVSLTGIYLYSIFSAFAIISNLSSSTWVIYIKASIVILEFIEGTVHALFILLALRKRLGRKFKNEYPGREVITLLIMLDLSLWFEKTTTTTKHEANPFQLAFYHVIPWSIIAAIATPLQIFFRFHASVCLSHVWANMYRLPQSDLVHFREV